MNEIRQIPLTAEMVKAKARELGAVIVGIADGKAMDRHPPSPDNPRRPSDITALDGERVIVLGLPISAGTARTPAWNHRHKFYSDELTITELDEIALNLVQWLERNGYPALIVPANLVDAQEQGLDPTKHLEPLLSLDHAAVEAGLGTLGLNMQLVTPEYGPRVLLASVLSSVDVEPDAKMDKALCKGPDCGRCLRACPGDAVGHWDRDWEACDPYRSPTGFAQATDFLEALVGEDDPELRSRMLRTEESFNLWQGVMRGVGVITGCRRCQDVCPVGADYARMIGDALDEIAEETPQKLARLVEFAAVDQAEGRSPARAARVRWIGKA